MADVTQLLLRAKDGDEAAKHALAPIVYDELKRLAEAAMRREQRAHTVQATALVSDAFMKLVGETGVEWDSRGHFFAFASRVMRRVLVDHARARGAQKRGGDVTQLEFDDAVTVAVGNDNDILRVEEALQALALEDPRQAEMVTMRFFGGMSMQQVAEAMGISRRTAQREWTMIKAWLRRELAR